MYFSYGSKVKNLRENLSCFVTDCFYLEVVSIMEITDGNLHVLAGYLQKTLSPDPVERRGGLVITHYNTVYS